MSTSTTIVELDPRRSAGSQNTRDHYELHEVGAESIPNTEPRAYQSLETTDGGPSALKLLLAAFFFEAILWGFATSFGVFQNYYAQLPQFANNPYVPYIGSIAAGIPYLGAPFIATLVRRFPKYQRQMIWAGWPLCILGILAGSFVNTVPGLIFTQGVMYGVGFVILYSPIISMVNEWWVVRRGLAWGIIASASGASGAAFMFIVEASLHRYGHKTTLRGIALGCTVLTGPMLPYFKARLPAVEHSVASLGVYFPSLYLPSYASSIGLKQSEGALLLALMSVSQIFGQFTFGFLSDGRIPLNGLLILSTVMSALASFTLWGLARNVGLLIAFSIVYGFFAYGYVSMRVRMGTAVTGDPVAALAIFAVFCFGQGVGNVLAGPLSAGLLTRIVDVAEYGASRYSKVIIFTGSTMLVSGACIGSWHLRPRTLRNKV